MVDRTLSENGLSSTGSIEFIDAMKWVFMPHINIDVAAEMDGFVFESKELLEYILNSIQDGISVLDNDLNIRYVNALMRHWYSDSDELIDQKCYRAYHQRSAPCENCPILKAIEHKTPFVGIVKYSLSGDQGDHKGWQELFAIPILDGNNQVLGVNDRLITLHTFHGPFMISSSYNHIFLILLGYAVLYRQGSTALYAMRLILRVQTLSSCSNTAVQYNAFDNVVHTINFLLHPK